MLSMRKGKAVKLNKFFGRVMSAFVLAAALLLLIILPLTKTKIISANSSEGVADISAEWQKFIQLDTTANSVSLENRFIASGETRFFAAVPIYKDFTIEAEGEPAVFVLNQDWNYWEDQMWAGLDSDLKNRHFVLNGEFAEDKTITVTIRNIIFRSADGFGGLYILGGNYAGYNGVMVNLILEDCVFEGLGGEEVLGGVLQSHSATRGNFNVIAVNCVFKNNTAKHGAVARLQIYPSQANPNSHAAFVNCTFIDNISYGHQGSFLTNLNDFAVVNTLGGELSEDFVQTWLAGDWNSGNMLIPAKEGFVFKEWNRDGIYLTAVWDKIISSEPFPVRATVLIVAGCISVIGVCIFFAMFVFRRRKRVLETANISDTPSDSVTGAENLDGLAERYGLTAREKEVAALLAEGKTRTDIASELFLSVATVKTHIHNIYGKLEIKSRFELLAKLNHAD